MLDVQYYRINGDGELLVEGIKVEKINFIYLETKNSRVQFEDMKLGGAVLCASDAALNPNRGKDQKEGPCELCEFSQWTKLEDGKNIAPDCTLIHNIQCFDILRKQFFSFQVKRASIKPFKKFMSQMILQFDMQITGVPLELSVIGEIKVKSEKHNKKSYYLPEFKVDRKATDKEAGYFMNVHRMYFQMQGGSPFKPITTHQPQQQIAQQPVPQQQQNPLQNQNPNVDNRREQNSLWNRQQQQPKNYTDQAHEHQWNDTQPNYPDSQPQQNYPNNQPPYPQEDPPF